MTGSASVDALAGTDFDLAAIAALLGLRSPSHFITMFKASHGVSPSTWRAERRRLGRLGGG